MVPAACPIQPRVVAKHPAVRLIPLLAVEVAPEVMRRLPDEMSSPFDEARPAVEIPPENVDVADEVLRIEPPVMVRPWDEERPDDWMPPVNVEDALPTRLSAFACTPPVNVEVPAPVATTPPTVDVPVTTALPTIPNAVPGVVVPIPRNPLERMTRARLPKVSNTSRMFAVWRDTAESARVVVATELESTESFAYGEVVPIPTR